MGYVRVSVQSFHGQNPMEVLASHITSALEMIKPYMATFVVREILGSGVEIETPHGSGTFVSTCGFEGVLTDYHIAEPLLRLPEFSLCVLDTPHRLDVTAPFWNILGHAPIGTPPRNTSPEEGPDLSFLILHDTALVEQLKNVGKRFYPLDSVPAPSLHRMLQPRIWAIAGSLSEPSRRVEGNLKVRN